MNDARKWIAAYFWLKYLDAGNMFTEDMYHVLFMVTAGERNG